MSGVILIGDCISWSCWWHLLAWQHSVASVCLRRLAAACLVAVPWLCLMPDSGPQLRRMVEKCGRGWVLKAGRHSWRPAAGYPVLRPLHLPAVLVAPVCVAVLVASVLSRRLRPASWRCRGLPVCLVVGDREHL